MRNGTTSLSFSVVHGGGNVIHLVIPGFRLMDGKITPPTSGKHYQPNYFAGREVLVGIYDAVEKTGWHATYKLTPLLPFVVATGALRLTTDRLMDHAPKYAPDVEHALEMKGSV